MLRILDKHDIPDIITIEKATQESPWAESIFTRCFDVGYDFWGMEVDNKIIAFVVMSGTSAGEYHILNLCVHPDHQRKGIAQGLMEYAMQQAKSRHASSIIYLEVRRSNTNAIFLYYKLGFSRISERKGYYPTQKGREDALVLAKDLGVD